MDRRRLVASTIAAVLFASASLDAERPMRPEIRDRILHNGRLIDVIEVPGGLPPAVKMATSNVPVTNKSAGINVLTNVPAFDWSYGCSATSAAMMAGYYDNTGYPNMYSGPTNGGVCPMTNAAWGYGRCPLSATEQGVDGLASRGHVDDYWLSFGHSGPDPYISGGWPQHAHADCTGDFMKTNQASYGNSDGATTLYMWNDGSPFSSSSYPADGGFGVELFFESRGYTVETRFNQYIVEQGLTHGFSYAQYQQEIDAGHPMLIHVSGHTMIGYGYNTSGSLVYIHDTWDHVDHHMTWGGAYAGMTHYGVTVVRLADNSSVFSDGFESHDMTRWSAFAP